MGFFSSLLSNVLPAIGTLFGGAPAAPVALPAPAPAPAPMVAPLPAPSLLDQFQIAGPGAARLIQTGARTGTGAAILAAQAGAPRPLPGVGPQIPGAQQLGFSGGNGQTFRRTFVQTVDIRSGQVLRNITLQGAPFLMNKEVNQLRRTARKLTKANAKIPRRIVRESLTKQLTDAALTSALSRTRACPPKDC